MGEILSPQQRGRIILASQIVAVVVFGLLGILPALFWVPTHYQWVIYLYCVLAFVIVVPVSLWVMPESPRWLEAHGRHAQAEQVIESLEKQCLKRSRENQSAGAGLF